MQWLTAKEVELCLRIMKEKAVCGMESIPCEEEWTEEDVQGLFQKNILRAADTSYQVDEKMFLCFHTICRPDTYICFNNQEKEEIILYIKGETIVYLEIGKNNSIGILWIPTLPLAIGAYTSFVKRHDDIKPEYRAEADPEGEHLRIEVRGKKQREKKGEEWHMVLEACPDGEEWKWKEQCREKEMTEEQLVNEITKWFAEAYSVSVKEGKEWQNFQ